MKMKQTIDEGIDNLFKVVNTTLKNDVKLSLQEYETDAGTLVDKNISEIKSVDNEVDSFADTSNRLVYQPTKSTPEKKVFQIPEKVPANRLFSDILAEVRVCGKGEKRSFQEMMSVNDVVDEVDESNSNQSEKPQEGENPSLAPSMTTPASIKATNKKARQSGSVSNKKPALKETNSNEENIQPETQKDTSNLLAPVKLNVVEELNEKTKSSIEPSKVRGKRQRANKS